MGQTDRQLGSELLSPSSHKELNSANNSGQKSLVQILSPTESSDEPLALADTLITAL